MNFERDQYEREIKTAETREVDLFYRPDLPPVPERMRRLPIVRGYPVPWFVERINGLYDFRIQDWRKRRIAVRDHLCWLCGQQLGRHLAFVIGPMCAINRISAEPPSHRECAEFAVKGCPFLTQKEVAYRATNLPEGIEPPSGIMITRQPGVALIWMTHSFRLVGAGNDFLIRLGDPIETLWWREGRAATRAEVLDSIESGCPILRDAAELDGPNAVAAYERAKEIAMEYLPAA